MREVECGELHMHHVALVGSLDSPEVDSLGVASEGCRVEICGCMGSWVLGGFIHFPSNHWGLHIPFLALHWVTLPRAWL